ncbi:MAG: hypothetical protein R3C13_08980 [Hyphomonas sp.]|uniref:hypothetical protein n=1 Tax=Hyphomonas sp. TaxID=87 RepID=UPI0035285746
MRRLAISLAACLATALGAGSAHAQFLKDPELLARYESLSGASAETADIDAALDAFAVDYLRTAKSEEARCLFGCNSGYSADGPDYTGPLYREFLAHADMVALATELQAPDVALRHLDRAGRLLSDQWKLQSILRTSSEPEDLVMDVMLNVGWLSYEGCSGRFEDPSRLVGPLLTDVEELKRQGSLAPAQIRELASVEQKLQEIRPLSD